MPKKYKGLLSDFISLIEMFSSSATINNYIKSDTLCLKCITLNIVIYCC